MEKSTIICKKPKSQAYDFLEWPGAIILPQNRDQQICGGGKPKIKKDEPLTIFVLTAGLPENNL